MVKSLGKGNRDARPMEYAGNGIGYVQPVMRDDYNNKFCLFQPFQGGWRGEVCPRL